MIICPFYSI